MEQTDTDFVQKWRERATQRFYSKKETPQYVRNFVAKSLELDPHDALDNAQAIVWFLSDRAMDVATTAAGGEM